MNTADMQSGPELDRLVAEQVMGWHVTDRGFYAVRGHGEIYRTVKPGPDYWNPSTDIAQAWEVIANLAARANPVRLIIFQHDDAARWACAIQDGDPSHGSLWMDCHIDGVLYAPTAPLAICRAALHSVMRHSA